jgi:hypothetical protein
VTDTLSSPWQVVSGTSLGAHHLLTGAPNQDAVLARSAGPEGRLVAISVADGHGSEYCFRSDVGSQAAVEIATRLGVAFLQRHGHQPGEIMSSAATEELIPLIVQEWITQVNEHCRLQPLTEYEKTFLRSGGEESLLLPYGTTLLLALLTDHCGLVLQIGDGDAIAVDTCGNVSLPVPQDPDLVAGATASLCSSRAPSRFRVGRTDPEQGPIALWALVTDGYGNSFSDPQWQRQVGADLLRHLSENGAEWVQERLVSWLAESASTGGDDVSMVLAVRGAPR